MAKPRWNFANILLIETVKLSIGFRPLPPQSPKITQAVEKALAQAKP